MLNAIGQRGRAGRDLEATAAFTLDLHGADLTHISLEDADLAGANLSRAKPPRVFARNVDLSGTSLYGAVLYEMSGYQIELSGADLLGVNMTSMEAPNTNFSNANLFGADLSGAQLRGSNFAGTLLSQNDLTTVQLEGTDFSGAHLRADVVLTQYQLDHLSWAPGNPPVLPSGATDPTTGKPLLLRDENKIPTSAPNCSQGS